MLLELLCKAEAEGEAEAARPSGIQVVLLKVGRSLGRRVDRRIAQHMDKCSLLASGLLMGQKSRQDYPSEEHLLAHTERQQVLLLLLSLRRVL